MTSKLSKLAFCSLIAVSISSTSVLAESMAAKIKKRATETAELKALLNDPDQSMRLAALDTMLKSEDTAMRELAYNVGLNSADDAVRSITLRNKFNELSTLAVNVTLPEKVEKNSSIKEYYTKYAGGGIFLITFEKYEERKGAFKFKDISTYTSLNGSVSGLTLSFQGKYCTGSLVLNEESEFQGKLNCKGESYPATAVVL